jgi:hypothetical protein
MTRHTEPVDFSFASSRNDQTTIYRHTGIFDGAELTVLYTLHNDEHAARVDSGLGAVEDERTLAALIELPSDSLGLLDPQFTSVFADPTSSEFAVVVKDPDGQLWGQRRLSVPVDILEIEARARGWKHAAPLAHRWVGYAPRTVCLVDVQESDAQTVLTEASFYGIGVACATDGSRLLAPADFISLRWTSARWWFAERVYAQFLTLTATRDF